MMTKKERSEYNKNHYKKNKEKISDYKKNWYRENRCDEISKRKRYENYHKNKYKIKKHRKEKLKLTNKTKSVII